MHRISIRGVKNAKIRSLFRKAINHFLEEILGSRLLVYIEFKFSGIKKLCNVFGECEVVDTGYSPRNFIIEVDNEQSLKMQLRTIVHELIHVKQYARNEMYDYVNSGARTRWRDSVVDLTKVDYEDFPWEIEAHASELPFVRKFLKEHKIRLKDYD